MDSWYEQVEALRQLAVGEPHRAGLEALRLFEDWLFENAQDLGYRKTRGGMREYVDFVARRGRLAKAEAARARRFTDVRNCVSHRSGLLLSASLTEELLDFIATLFRRTAWEAEHLMTRRPHTVQPDADLREARDWMLDHAVSQLPVVDEAQRVVGLLTNRDIVALQAGQPEVAERAELRVADAMSADALETVHFLPLAAPYDEVLAHLQQPHVAACLVTDSGDPGERLRGIITVSDVLTKL